jgi:hypothetical protein
MQITTVIFFCIQEPNKIVEDLPTALDMFFNQSPYLFGMIGLILFFIIVRVSTIFKNFGSLALFLRKSVAIQLKAIPVSLLTGGNNDDLYLTIYEKKIDLEEIEDLFDFKQKDENEIAIDNE